MSSFPYSTDPDRIHTVKVKNPIGVEVYYACPSACWREHLDAWSKARRNNRGKESEFPQPMPSGHCMFSDPISYGKVYWGETDKDTIRAAVRVDVRSNLVGGGWTRDVPADVVDRIVDAAVEEKLNGNSTVGMYFACVAHAIS